MKKGKYTESEIAYLRKHIDYAPETLALVLDRPTTGVKVTLARLRAETPTTPPTLTPEQEDMLQMLLPLLGETLARFAVLNVPDEDIIDAVDNSVVNKNRCALTGAAFSDTPFDPRTPYYDEESKLFITAMANKMRGGYAPKAFADFCRVVTENFAY